MAKKMMTSAGTTQDIALIDQSLAQLQDKLKAIVESINENLGVSHRKWQS